MWMYWVTLSPSRWSCFRDSKTVESRLKMPNIPPPEPDPRVLVWLKVALMKISTLPLSM